jgi:MFS family permease
VLHAWGSAGTFTMVAELLPERDHLPANALLGMLAQVGVLLGPAIAALVIAGHGAASVLAVDAATFRRPGPPPCSNESATRRRSPPCWPPSAPS